jgi:hypothetical protein
VDLSKEVLKKNGVTFGTPGDKNPHFKLAHHAKAQNIFKLQPFLLLTRSDQNWQSDQIVFAPIGFLNYRRM